ncbi:hypothetical protein A2533_01705 [Candidatus Falkowbacteria bacterium RIFOXYD2_FULL_35_9]|uniref:Polymerase/histidinol phosphatase N-terminal domain-containing protein n=1 Tax=Candidatus Falkowbacteria bacterium RIFOXYC2_FULL_36_12 TaxID=1798002 RepID=A0A1F5T040_9BACT|nr:MAG: hypothetical protein A2300_04225 [Candidatus Falkowbacteria bacterium RIFOXYB2_FULL_35_7]OGF32282.1 MAG: hypothetical protein A2478_03070 [Candidatus Falkowbacteria bacterium RIFOXYC2_FULL_36_12]OGF33859.1 MAG: hypothetical protein A2223_01280 [Candidatus Falkowbacteria bacterium RIFOXYA2_FULL_35_8]OGF47954.1 MAG: hypothetical protein A2533_01705 [Candidatus Falkowbacteria bacterium RIFOXYD2_FULL_35_9]
MPNFPVDMHIHSHYSDGYFPPTEIVRQAYHAGLTTICLTDHDCWYGLPKFMQALKIFGLQGLAGIEISSFLNGEILHILGYGIDYTQNELLESILRPNWQVINQRAEKSLEAYKHAGLVEPSLTLQLVNQLLSCPSPCTFKLWLREFRQKFGHVSFAQAIAETSKHGIAFAKFNKDKLISSFEAIRLIHMLGGIAVWAHPGKILTKDPALFNDLLIALIRQGKLDGLELNHQHNFGFETTLVQIATEYELITTGGSDFHGKFKPDVLLGTEGISEQQFTAFKTSLNIIKNHT